MKNLKLTALLLALTVAFTGCGGSKGNTETPAVQIENPSVTRAGGGIESTEVATGASGENENPVDENIENIDATGLAFKDRFLSGKRNVYYINDDGSLANIFKCGDGEEIVHLETADDYAYILSSSESDGYTLYYKGKDGDIESIKPEKSKDAGIYNTAVYNNKFYYDYYDTSLEWYPIYYFDTAKKEFVRDNELERVRSSVEAYKGKSLMRLGYSGFMVDDFGRFGKTYMRDADEKKVYAFDDKGNELNSFDMKHDLTSWAYADDKYLFGDESEYKESGQINKTTYLEIETADGKEKILYESGDEDRKLYVVDLKDDMVYYYIEESDGNGDVSCRKYYRDKLESFDPFGNKGELLIEIPAWTGISAYYDFASNNANGFSVKGDRAYYLWFFDDDKEGHKGDILWCSVGLNSPDKKPVISDAVEGHAPFADYGHIEKTSDSKTENNFRYFKGTLEFFYFNDDIKNADKMNKVLDEKYADVKAQFDETAEMGYNDVFGGETEYDFENDWVPTYSYDYNFGGVSPVGSHYFNVFMSDYAYYGGAHGMPGEFYYLFDADTGDIVTLKDLYKGSEEEFKDMVIKHSIEDWKNDGNYKYYEEYDPANEESMKETFAENISFDMDMYFDNDTLHVVYQPYAVGPYAAGFIEIPVPYSELGISLS